MTERWAQAFGDVPEPFERRVRVTVGRMQAGGRTLPRRLPVRAALAVAVAIALLLGTALALSGLGVLETLNENLRRFLLPGAGRLVQTAVTQTARQPDHATFTLEEAINDGRQIYATVRVHGGKGVLLMDANAEPAWALGYWRGDGEGQTFSNLAYETGRALISAGCEPVDAQGTFLAVSAPEIAYDGEDILYTLAWPAQAPDIRLRLTTVDLYAPEDARRLSVGWLEAAIPVTDARSFATTPLPVTIPTQDGALLLTGFQVEQTPIATYMRFVFGAADPADEALALRLAGGIWPQWLDAQGQPYPQGENGGSLTADGAGNTCCTVVYPAASQLPGAVTLRFHGGMWRWDDPVITIPVQPMDAKEVLP